MKCTQCGCTKFVNVKNRMCSNIKIFICDECGHLEFFDTRIIDIRQSIKAELRDLIEKEKNLELALQVVQSQSTRLTYEEEGSELYDIKDRINFLNSLLQDNNLLIKEYLSDYDIVETP